MIEFFNSYTLLLLDIVFACAISAIVLIIFRKRRKHRFYPLIVLTLFTASCIIGYYAMTILGSNMQRAIALPYVQQALNDQCRQTTIIADEQGFYKQDDVLYWDSSDGTSHCYFSGKAWVCQCRHQ
jgi:hypothetical protein